MLIHAYDASDRLSVAALELETEVDSVAELRLTDGRFTGTESPLKPARKKHHDLAAYLDEVPLSWDDGFVATLHGRVIGFAPSSIGVRILRCSHRRMLSMVDFSWKNRPGSRSTIASRS